MLAFHQGLVGTGTEGKLGYPFFDLLALHTMLLYLSSVDGRGARSEKLYHFWSRFMRRLFYLRVSSRWRLAQGVSLGFNSALISSLMVWKEYLIGWFCIPS
jgi:hypothetical protein